jgi:hypothetical protein
MKNNKNNTGVNNTGENNSGDWNSGDGNSGIFNTNEPKMRSFNKECDMTYTEFREKFGYKDIDLPLNVWVDEENMTDEEKKSVRGYKDIGGYLKTLSYKDAWKEGWKNATQEQKDWYKSLPNFDTRIFEEITGINVSESLIGADVEVKVNGKSYKAKIVEES